jgi:hypothetical protein
MDTPVRLKPARIKPVRSALTLSGFLYEVSYAGQRRTCLSLSDAWRHAVMLTLAWNCA